MNEAVAKQRPREQKAERLFDVADQQAGYFTARQALEAGYDYPLQHYHRERGHWTQVGHGLFRLNRYPEGGERGSRTPVPLEPRQGRQAAGGRLP